MRRSNIYLTEKQVERLQERSEKEGLAVSELVRRAIDSFLAWDDPTYEAVRARSHPPSRPPIPPQ
jgi:hypothetical protein